MVRARWEDDENWTEIHSEREWKEMIKQEYEIPVHENNRDLSHCLIVAVPKKKHC